MTVITCYRAVQLLTPTFSPTGGGDPSGTNPGREAAVVINGQISYQVSNPRAVRHQENYFKMPCIFPFLQII